MLMTYDVVEQMRQDISIDVPREANSTRPTNFTVSFQYSEPATAMRVTSELASAFIDGPAPYYGRERDENSERRTVIESARLPEEPFSPRLLPYLAIGALAGSGVGVVFFLNPFLSDRRAQTRVQE